MFIPSIRIGCVSLTLFVSSIRKLSTIFSPLSFTGKRIDGNITLEFLNVILSILHLEISNSALKVLISINLTPFKLQFLKKVLNVGDVEAIIILLKIAFSKLHSSNIELLNIGCKSPLVLSKRAPENILSFELKPSKLAFTKSDFLNELFVA